MAETNGLRTCDFSLIKCPISYALSVALWEIDASPGSPTLTFTLIVEDDVGVEMAPEVSGPKMADKTTFDLCVICLDSWPKPTVFELAISA